MRPCIFLPRTYFPLKIQTFEGKIFQMHFLRDKLQLRWHSFRIVFDLIQRRVPPENDFSPKYRSIVRSCIGGGSFCRGEGRRVENRGNFRARKLSEVSANCICIHRADLLKKNIPRKRNLHIIMRTGIYMG